MVTPLPLRIRSAHLGLPDYLLFLKEDAYKYKVNFARLMAMPEKTKDLIKAGLSKSKKKIGGNHAFFIDNSIEKKSHIMFRYKRGLARPFSPSVANQPSERKQLTNNMCLFLWLLPIKLV